MSSLTFPFCYFSHIFLLKEIFLKKQQLSLGILLCVPKIYASKMIQKLKTNLKSGVFFFFFFLATPSASFINQN